MRLLALHAIKELVDYTVIRLIREGIDLSDDGWGDLQMDLMFIPVLEATIHMGPIWSRKL